MKIIGIICEYNPFHNGHLYHLEKIKEMFRDSLIILVISPTFTQRGEISLLTKWQKTEIALSYHVDLVIELPFPFATQSADTFAKGAVDILNYLKCDYLVFGSESNQVEELVKIAKIVTDNQEYETLVKGYMQEGNNYPTALSKALKDITNVNLTKPNDLLGLSYIKEIIRLSSKMEPITIKRTNDYHAKDLDQEITSATSIRNGLIEKKDISKFIPLLTLKHLPQNLHFLDIYFQLLKFQIISHLDELDKIQTVDEGLDKRIKKYIFKSNSLAELIGYLKTKRYTYNRLNRMFIHILCNFTKEKSNNFKEIEYLRVLGFNKRGQSYLKKIKKEINIPIITNYSSLKNEMLEYEFKITSIYIMLRENKVLLEEEIRSAPIIITDKEWNWMDKYLI